MKRKLFIVVISFFAMYLVIYAQNNNLFAATNSTDFHKILNIGDKILMGERLGNPVLWDVGAITNQQYSLMTTVPISANSPMCSNTTKNGYLDNGIYLWNCDYVTSSSGYDNSIAYEEIKSFNDNAFNVIEKSILIDMSNLSNGALKYAFIPRGSDFKNLLGFSSISKGAAYQVGSYWISDYSVRRDIAASYDAYNKMSTKVIDGSFDNTGYPDKKTLQEGLIAASAKGTSGWILADIRAFSVLNSDRIVFSMDKNFNDTSLHEMIVPNTIANDRNTTKGLAVRVKSDENKEPFIRDIKSGNNISSTQVLQGDSIHIEYENTSALANQWISVLLKENSSGKEYYKRIAISTGNGKLQFDIENLPIGNYKLYLLNETIDTSNSSIRMIASSELSNVKDIEVVPPLSNLNFTATDNLTYKVNANMGDIVGSITSLNGIGSSVYTLVADAAHASDVDKFEIGADGKSVQVKGNDLDASTYYFKVQAQDASGNPVTPLEVSATVTVTKVSTSIAFDNVTRTNKSTVQSQTPWNETATSTPANNELKITYSKQSGDVGIITINPDTGEVQASSVNVKGKVTIQATVDDSPVTGKDNYEAISTTKEIMIYQEVNGSITPDSTSSDSTNPTFGAMDENIKIGGMIGVIVGSEGTPDNGVSGTKTYTYGLKNYGDSSYFDVNTTTGAITSKVNLSIGTYTITVTVSDKWSTKEIPVTISVGQASAEALKFYDSNNKNTIITSQSASLNDDGISVFAEVKGSNNASAVKYGIKSGASTSVVDVHLNSGAISIKSVGTTTITATKQGEVGQAEAYSELTFTVTIGTQNFIYTDNAGNELPRNGDGSYQSYKDVGKDVVYQKDKNFQLYTNGAPAGATVTYAIKNGSPLDVVRVDEDGKVHILNASLPIQTDKIIVEAKSKDPNGNYADKTIEIPINIAKADVAISFNGVTNVVSGKGSVDPLINDQNISSNEGGASVLDTQYIISVDESVANDIAWTNDGISINYEYSEETGIDIPLKVTKPANRNYNKAEASGILHILSPTENILEVSTPGKIIYGDTFTIRSLQDDSSSTNVTYTFTSKDTNYIKENIQTENQMKFDAIKASGNSEIEVDVERSAYGELPLKKTIKVKVLPKDINIKVDDKEKLYGESNPVFSIQDFTNQLISWNNVKDTIQANDVKITTTANINSVKGDYPITVDTNYLNTTYPNYKFHSENAKLTINQDNISSDWYRIEIGDGIPYTGTWTNQNVLFISIHNSYIHVSDDSATWFTPRIKIETEGSKQYNFWMKNNTGAITSAMQAMIKIDKQTPRIKKIEAESSSNILEDILNKLSLGYFFKPGTMFTVSTDDSNGEIEVSKTNELEYSIQKKQVDGSFKPMEATKKVTQVANEKAIIKVGESSGVYRICAIAIDYAGNRGNEECRDVKMAYPGVNESSDGDELPDLNIDTNDDGIPDLNITKNPGDKKPWVNIDGDGDGKIDMNLDRDNDRIPYLNTGVVMEWKCDGKVDIDGDGKPDYRTSTTLKGVNNLDTDADKIPDLNIDLDLNGLPDLNINTDGKFDKPNIEIDGNGDGKADINIDETKDGKADKNIVEIKEWKPEHNVKEEDRVRYDTMLIENPEGKKELEDNNIIVEQPNGSFLPNYALKVDVITTTIEQDLKDKIIEKANGQVIKEVYTVELMKDGVQVQPDGRLKIKIPLPKGIISPHLIIELADGSYRKISAEVIGEYLVYESDFLGKVIIVGNSDVVSLPDEDSTPNSGGTSPQEPTPPVKGNYVSNAGANTGDSTTIFINIASCVVSLLLLILMMNINKQRHTQ